MIAGGSSFSTRSSVVGIAVRDHLLGVDRRVEQEVDQRVGALAVGRVLRHGVEVAPDLAAFLADHVLHLRQVAMQLRRVAGPAYAGPGVAVAQGRLVVAGDREQVRLDLEQQLLGLGQLLGVDRIERVAEILERVADRGQLVVVDGDPAGQLVLGHVPELLPAGHRRRHLGGVDDVAGGAPVLGHGVDLAVDAALVHEPRLVGGGVEIGQHAPGRAAR